MGNLKSFFGIILLFVSLGFVSAQLNVPTDLPQSNVLQITPGTVNADSAGFSSDFLGDITGDGYSEIIVGAPGLTLFGSAYQGLAYLIDGKNGVVLNQFGSVSSGSTGFGFSVTELGDVNNNGFGDIAISGMDLTNPAIPTAILYVYEAGGNPLYQTNLGALPIVGSSISLDNAGDVNGDGINDVVVGLANQGTIVLVDGSNGAILYSIPLSTLSPNIQCALGASVAGVGDIDNDGRSDVVAGCFQQGAYIFSGASGSQIGFIPAPNVNDNFGISVAGRGDYNGDGINDIVVGAPNALSNLGGYVRIYSGNPLNNFPLLFQFNGPASARIGGAIGLMDFNNDGLSDVVVMGALTGNLYIYDAATSTLRFSWPGQSVSGAPRQLGVGDLNGDGVSSEIVSATLSGASPGSIWVRSLGGAYPYGSGSLTATWTPAGNPSVNPASGTITVTGANPAASSGFVLCSAASANIPVSTGNTLYVDPNSLLINPIPITFSASGSWTSPLLGLQNAAAAGTEVFCQVIAYSGGPIQNAQFSNGEQLTLVA